LGEISVKGSSAPVAVVEVYDQDSPEVRNFKDQIEPIMAEGIDLFRDGRFDAALSKFEEAQPIFPQDLPLNLLITSLKHALKQGRAVKGGALLNFK
jgi:hypothetical protein